ncbi:MAG: branched-chain amino acid ABC transporter permease [Acetobacteraceae bacterium]|nr:branched-chain amino acid ABC transporter permease [Acetobacteraceae bacterium]
MQGVAHQLLSGIATGGIYASMALALVMIYQTTHHVNFAQGEMATFSAYIAYTLISAGVPYWLAFITTILVSFFLGAVIERLIMRPMAGKPALASVGAFIGLLLLFNSLSGWIWGYEIKAFPTPFDGSPPFLAGVVSGHELGSFCISFAMLLLVYLFFRRTTLGLALRAAAHNPLSSRLVGIRVQRMFALGWGLAAALGAVAAMLIAPVVFLDPNMMGGVMLYAFAGALLGGINSPFGAVLGGYAVGIMENLAGAYLVGTELKLTLALAIIICVLIIKPSGLLGRAITTRV